MIIGIGIDLVELDRLKELMSDRFIDRILSPEEKKQYLNIAAENTKLSFIGGRFAAKEALFKATNKPVGIDRADFGFMNWPNFNEQLWKKVYADANKAVLNEYPNVKGIEIDHKTFQIAKENMVRAGFMPIHHLEQGDFFKYKPKENQGVVVLNPPYDERIKSDDIIQLYKEIGNHLKQNFQGWTAWIISGNVEARKHIGLKTSQKIKLFNGKIETRLLKFELY